MIWLGRFLFSYTSFIQKHWNVMNNGEFGWILNTFCDFCFCWVKNCNYFCGWKVRKTDFLYFGRRFVCVWRTFLMMGVCILCMNIQRMYEWLYSDKWGMNGKWMENDGGIMTENLHFFVMVWRNSCITSKRYSKRCYLVFNIFEKPLIWYNIRLFIWGIIDTILSINECEKIAVFRFG